MEGSWIISRPLSVVGGGAAEGGAEAAPTMRLADFVASLEAIAASSLDPLAIWRAGQAMDLADLGVLGCTVALAPTLGAALRAFHKGFGALQSASSVDFQVEDDRASFSYRILDNEVWPRRADSELTLAVLSGIARRFAPDATTACALNFEHDPRAQGAAFAATVGSVPRQGETNAIVFPARLLDRRRAESEGPDTARAFREAMVALETHLRAMWLRQPVSHRVWHAMMERIGRDDIDQDAIARALGVSRRTLRRQLDAEGTSFHELTESCRRNVGHALLVRTDLPMIEISMRLGYSDHTAFSRAFSRWFGASPRELRKAGSGASATS
ncbi:AraC-like transcriptional regulator QhpR [Paracoccus sanguinis]|uniref:AraC-like transcriptional regulator QhpR n=1 Tax=Paracoccus sanguinis TaxID=1545044 RepID=UPI0005BD87B8|nr:AraC family transcriptional regulator [Paracoccus sanguinis]